MAYKLKLNNKEYTAINADSNKITLVLENIDDVRFFENWVGKKDVDYSKLTTNGILIGCYSVMDFNETEVQIIFDSFTEEKNIEVPELSKEEKLKLIVIDSLRTRTQTFTQTIPELRHGDRDILCAIRISSLLKLDNFDTTIKIAKFVKDSWTDLESTDEQIQSIIEFVIDIKIEYSDSDILNNL